MAAGGEIQRAAVAPSMTAAEEARLRGWLEYVIDTAIDMLDAMDAAMADREPEDEGDEAEVLTGKGEFTGVWWPGDAA